jgi:hypothetical protein
MSKQSDLKDANAIKQKMLQELYRFEQEVGDSTDLDLTDKRDLITAPPVPDKNYLNPDGIVDIVTFCEHPYFLGLKLTPWQKLICKAFYSGSAGNTHLQIEKEKPETGCEGCVWKSHFETEVNFIKQMQQPSRKLRPEEPAIKPENSPCLQCSRYNTEDRKFYYEFQMSQALNNKAKEQVAAYQDRPVYDLHTTEWEMLHTEEVSERVRQQIIEKWGGKFQELILVLGRRSGKSFMVSVIALYEVYRFLMMEHPQARFPLTEFDTISIVNIANSQKQAKGAIFDKMRSYCFKSPYFSAHVGKDIQGEIHFLTPHDKKENERRIAQGNSSLLTGTIQAISGHSNSSTLVGLTVAVVIIDEMAEMAGNNPEGNADEILYDKLKPALATFGAEGKMICISNPLAPQGKFYNLFEAAFDDSLTLMFQLPTWLSNPTISKSWLESEKAKSRKTFNIFYGAQFSAGAGDTFLNEDDVFRAFRNLADHRRLEYGEPLQKYYMHLDPAHSSDNYTIAIVHTTPMIGELGPDGKELQKVIVDHIHYFEPKGPNQPINQDAVDQYVLTLAQRFHIVQCTYDQHWSSHASIARMKQSGIPCSMTPYTGQFQREIYQNLYELFVGGRIDFYGINTVNCEMPDGSFIALKDVSMARDQFLDLQRKYKGNGWKIEAPRGQKDDIPDCVAGAAFQAMKDRVFSTLPKPRSMSFNPWRQRI